MKKQTKKLSPAARKKELTGINLAVFNRRLDKLERTVKSLLGLYSIHEEELSELRLEIRDK